MNARSKSRVRPADVLVPSKDVQHLRKIRDRNPLPLTEQKVGALPVTDDNDDDDSEDEQPPTKKQAKIPAVAPKQHADEKEEKWALYYRAMQDFCANNIGKLPKQKLVYDFEGQRLTLGSFVDVLKQRHRGTGGRTPLSEEEKSMLETIPAWITGRERVDGDEHWEQMYGLLKDYEKKEGKLPTTRCKEQFQGCEVKEIGIWVQTQKKRLEQKGGLHGMKDEQRNSMREIPAWIAYEEKVSKRIAQKAQAAKIALAEQGTQQEAVQGAVQEAGSSSSSSSAAAAVAVQPHPPSALTMFQPPK